MIARLKQQHEDLQALTARLDAIVRAPSLDRQPLAQLRLEMSSLLREHLALEEQLIYAPLRTHPEAGAEMRRSDDDLRERRMTYSAHVSSWTPDRIVADWSQYRREVTALTRGLVTRIAYENDVLYPLFHRLFPQSRRAAAG